MQVGTEVHAGTALHAWRKFLAKSTLWLGVLLLGSAAVCWVAANWPDMTKMQRFGGAQVFLAVCALAAAWLGLRLRATPGVRRSIPGALLALAGLLLGALLALLGQTYQTGADTWELFGWWAALLLPWALAASSQAVWLLWVLVLNLAVSLWLGERVFTWMVVLAGPGFPSLVLAGLNLSLLLCWELAVRHWRASTLIGPRILAAITLGVLVTALMFGEYAIRGLATYTGIAWVVVTLGLGFYYQQARRDLVILAMLAAGVICVSLRVVGEWLIRMEPGVWVVLPLAGLLMAEAVWAARWLRRLAGEQRVPLADAEPAGASAGNALDPAEDGEPVVQLAANPQTLVADTPWYVHCLLGLSAWLATLLLLVFLAFSDIVSSTQGALVTGLVLCAIGVAVLRTEAGPFWRQCATAMAFAGQILVVYGLSSTTSFASGCIFLFLLGTAIYALAPDVILRFLSGGVIATALAGLIWLGRSSGLMEDTFLRAWMDFDVARATFVWLPMAVTGAWATAAIFCVGHQLTGKRANTLQPLAWAFALSAQTIVWLAAGISVLQLRTMWSLNPSTAVLLVAGALLPAASALAVLWPRRHLLTPGLVIGVPVGLLLLALFWLPSPGVSFALAWLLLGFGLNLPRLTAFGVISLLAYLGAYYYQLDVPLLQKALWLGGAAVLLFVLRVFVWLVPRLMRTQQAASREGLPPVSRALRWRTGAILAGLVLVLAVVNGAIWQRETLLSSGDVVVLELAPVDPRSLMQGDYVALRFDAGRDITRWRLEGDADADTPAFMGVKTDGYVVLTPDEKGVAKPVRIQSSPTPVGDKEIALRYRVREDGVRLVTNAFFFPEGQGQHFEQARYGQLRVGKNGDALLTGLLDPDLKPL